MHSRLRLLPARGHDCNQTSSERCARTQRVIFELREDGWASLNQNLLTWCTVMWSIRNNVWRPRGTQKSTVWQQWSACPFFWQFPCQALLHSHFQVWGMTKWISISKLDDIENKHLSSAKHPLLQLFPSWWLQGPVGGHAFSSASFC